MVGVIRLGGTPPPNNNGLITLGKRISPKGISIISPVTAARVLTSPKTTVGLAGVLGFLKGGIGGALTAAGLTSIGLGVLETSPTARKFAKEKIKDPTKAGRFVGEQIEKIAKPPLEDDKTLKEKVVGGLKTAGLIGGAAALAAGGVAIVKKVKTAKVPSILSPVVSPTSQISAIPASTITQQQPISAIPKEIPKEKVAVVPAKAQLPSIVNKIKVSPEINISFRKRRTFINQQINI